MKRRLLAASVAVLFLVTACEGEDATVVQDFMKDWLVSHAGQVVMGKLTGTSGDPMIDAAIQGQEVIGSQETADNQFSKAYASDDTATMDKLIADHPNDWGYKVDRASTALEQGNVGLYQQLSGQGETLDDDRLSVYQQELSDLKGVEGTLSGGGGLNGFKDKVQCQTLYSNLLRVSGVVQEKGGAINGSDRADWTRGYSNC